MVELESKLKEVRELAHMEIALLLDELNVPDVERDKILSFSYNSVVWTYKMDEGERRAYELRAYTKRKDADGKERVRQKYIATYPLKDEIKQKLERLAYLYRLIRIIDHEPKRGAIVRG